MTRLIVNHELDDQVIMNETEQIQGGGVGVGCYSNFYCDVVGADEENDDTVVF